MIPNGLVMIWSTGPHFGGNSGARTASYPMYQDFQREAKAFEFVFCRFETPSSITIDGGTERIEAELISGNYFQALGNWRGSWAGILIRGGRPGLYRTSIRGAEL